VLSLDLDYLKKLFQPTAPWGCQQPQNPLTGIFIMANTVKRPLPSKPNDPITHESIHSSVLQQPSVSPALSGILTSHPKIVSSLLPFEEEMKAKWAYDPSSPTSLEYEKKLKDQEAKKKKKISDNSPMTVSVVKAKAVQVVDKPDRTLMGRFFRVLRTDLRRNANI